MPKPSHCLSPHNTLAPSHGNTRTKRFFAKGVLRFVILDLITRKPSHGYEIIHDLEDLFHGFYSPSPGSVYPTLQQLQDLGYVTSDKGAGKKVYAVTEAGHSYLNEHTDIVKGLRRLFSASKHNHRWLHADFRDTAAELRLLGQALVRHAPNLSREQLGRIHRIVQQASREIQGVIESQSG